jgi:hypothetical protein
LADALTPTVMSTLLKLLLLPPELLKSHVKAYADLASELSAQYLCALKNRWVMYSFSALALLLALIFGGVALMLWSALPLQDAAHPWVLLALPVGSLAISVFCWWRARSLRLQPVLSEIQTQIQLDIQAIQQGHAA